MKLNPDCVRDVLLSVEKLHQVVQRDDGNVKDVPANLEEICADLQQYKKEDVYYTLKTLDDGGFISMQTQFADGGTVYHCRVFGLTYQGHEFVQKISDTDRWSHVKKIIGSVRDYSLEAISAVAEGVTKAGIQSFIQTTM